MDLSVLNKYQQEAVVTTEGAVMVMAGAGSGKTKVLTYRLAYLIDELGVNPTNILAVTFTNKAAREMKDRICTLLDRDISKMWISTFHSFGARFLRKEIGILGNYRNDFVIIDDEDVLKIIKEELKDKGLNMSAKDALRLISLVKNQEGLPELDRLARQEFDLIFESYQKHLLRENLLDFDDLLLLTVEILENNIFVLEKYGSLFNYIMIDEFQDTNKIQFKLINLLAQCSNNIFVVGDINQSIYSFRGARIENISLFKKQYNPKIIKLEQNYRSTQTILNIANNVISKNSSFVDMQLFTHGEIGERAKYFQADSYYGEVLYVIKEIRQLVSNGYQYKDIAILYRLNSLSLNFENEFIKANIPYIIYGGVGYFERKEVKDIIAYLRLLINSNDDFSFKRIVNTPKRKIGEKLLDNLSLRSLENNCSMYQAINYIENNLLNDFSRMIEELKVDLDKNSLADLIDIILDKTGYMAMLKAQEENDRIDNVLELKSIMRDIMEFYDGNNRDKLTAFLQDLALRTDVDSVSESDDKVKLMSFHQAKGLEYKVVFMVAMEQGVFPAYKSIGSTNEMEEERRICYVGITRAREKLYLTNARVRRLYGNDNVASPSEFIRLIDNKYLDFSTNRVSSGIINNVDSINKTRTIINGAFRPGDRIEHKAFGLGVVVKVEGDKITVAFSQQYGIKTLLSTHPSITRK